MTPQELKNSILQLAMQGNLVEQRPKEGTAEELYQQIQTEKQKLITAGTIKKEKPLPEITEDEKPFDIPESWKWVRIANLCSVINGDRGKNYPSKETLSKQGIPFISALNLNGKTVIEDENLLCMSEEQYQKLGNGKLNCGDVVCCIRGSLGKHGRYPYLRGAIASSLVILRMFLQGEIDVTYLMSYLDSPLFFAEIRRYDNGTAQPNLAAKSLELFLIPLPPLAEQKRIVSKIEELLPYIDRYEQAWSKLEDFNKRFPTDMQKSILQLSIRGKLVEQRAEEGTGEELYQLVQAEKQKLIQAGTIKKEKPLPEIVEDEKPFDIPESWRWIRLGFLTEFITSGSRDWAKYYADDGDIFLRMGNLSRNSYKLRLDTIQRVRLPQKAEGQRTALQGGDLLFSITGEVGMLGLIPDNFGTAYINQHTAMIRFISCVRNTYIPYLLLSDYAQKFYNGNQHGIKNSFRLDSIAYLPIPLPPLAEQKRIVTKLEEILPLCEKLK